MTTTDVTMTLRRVAALRALCLSLPHVPTPAERDRLRRFESLVAMPGAATAADVEALAAGWRRWWREQRRGELVAMARALPAGLVDGDRRLISYVCAATSDEGGAGAASP